MFRFIQRIAEERERKAIEEGQFDNLEGMGKPLPKDDWQNVPPELRMAYKVLKNAGYLPPELQDEKDIKRVLDMLDNAPDEQERYRQMQKLNCIITRINLRRKSPLNIEANQEYYQKAVERIRLSKQKAR